MLRKLLFSSMTSLLILNIISPLGTQAKQKNSIMNRFCIASLKSKLDLKDKQNPVEIIQFTCECFNKKFKSGFSLKKSRIYCRNKAVEKYDL